MPKASRKKKEKAADFTKAKLKLGKRKLAPANTVNTSFKARSIVLPNQSIAASSAPLDPSAHFKSSLISLVANLKHYNPATRRDTLSALQRLLEASPTKIVESLSAFLTPCARLIGDDDPSVRAAALIFFKSSLALVDPSALRPHARLLLLFTVSAQNHIFPEIRLDAIKVLDVLLHHIPDAVVAGWDAQAIDTVSDGPGAKLLQSFLSLLSIGPLSVGNGDDSAPGPSVVNLTLHSKSIVLASLDNFLAYALGDVILLTDEKSTPAFPTWYFTTSFSSGSAFASFDKLIEPSNCATGSSIIQWRKESDGPGDSEFVICVANQATLASSSLDSDLSFVGSRPSSVTAADDSESLCLSKVMALAKALTPLFISILLETAPTVFEPNSSTPPPVEKQLLVASMRLALRLYSYLFKHYSLKKDIFDISQRRQLSEYLHQLAVYFPIATGTQILHRITAEAENTCLELNVIYCQLVSMHVFATGSLSKQERQLFSKQLRSIEVQLDTLRGYLSKFMGIESESGARNTIATDIYIALLPTLWMLMNLEREDTSQFAQDIFQLVVSHDGTVASRSVLKPYSTEFICRAILLSGGRQTKKAVPYLGGVTPKWLLDWFVSLPRTLWEIGMANPAATEIIMTCLLRVVQQQPSWLSREVLDSVRSRYASYFLIRHPNHGVVMGPYCRLAPYGPFTLRSLALDLAYLLVNDNRDESDAQLNDAVLAATTNAPEYRIWVELNRAMNR